MSYREAKVEKRSNREFFTEEEEKEEEEKKEKLISVEPKISKSLKDREPILPRPLRPYYLDMLENVEKDLRNPMLWSRTMSMQGAAAVMRGISLRFLGRSVSGIIQERIGA